MTALLEDRVAAFISDRPDSTVPEILRAVPCLQKTLADILSNPLFECRDGLYRLAGTAGKREPVQPQRRVPQADRMLAVLRDGAWHSIGELWSVGVGRPNSRATDLRKRGLTVEHRHDRTQTAPSRVHQYRLAASEEVAGPVGGLPPVSATASDTEVFQAGGDRCAVAVTAVKADGQLVLSAPEFRRSAA